jgi:hypothetical protein
MTLSPAMGREYKSATAVRADQAAGKDFIVQTMGPDCGRYINLEDAQAGGLREVYIRYACMTKICVVKVGQ